MQLSRKSYNSYICFVWPEFASLQQIILNLPMMRPLELHSINKLWSLLLFLLIYN